MVTTRFMVNKTIEAIAYQHGLMSQGTPDNWDLEHLEKFADAIIEECIKMVEPTEEHRRDASWGYLGGEEGVELLDCIVEVIKEKFQKTDTLEK